jgi:hypothetical protein
MANQTSFNEIQNVDDFWQWFEGTFYTGIKSAEWLPDYNITNPEIFYYNSQFTTGHRYFF